MYKSLGCFKDKSKRDLSKQMGGGNGSREKCGAACAKAGMKYFGLQYGNQCFCGNSYGKYKKATNCNMKCKNGKETCGGTWANSVFQVRQFAYLGCYKDKGSRDLTKKM